ncbi:Tol-Pal system beta propeller repeat protein TolB [Dethiosulfatarculus sandiegensis]|uniref:Translocation protein TolB n=1 Tax=Dethiosulfatarculus sandiegensis TaxID=1429043 RepID=A0A0D2JFW9_9BACT|nr:Tol-Pal system beta propeller repeat protein TolB [Dethiosulfatarculus sandiegensis]KIX14576.1 translocation protein TolB [Dethiosulfatarculus sandiegensis]
MRKSLSLFFVLLFLLPLVTYHTAQARVYIDVTKPFSRKLPLALPEFQALEQTAPIGAKARGILQKDLEFTGLFDFLNPNSFLGQPDPTNLNYRRWSRVGAELLVTGNYGLVGKQLTMEMRLFDVVDGKLLVGRRYDGIPADLTRMMHRFADEIMLALTGDRSVFSSRIAFVGARQDDKGVNKEIYTMNFDGSRVRKLTNRKDICLYPNWSSDGGLLAYTSYKNRRPGVFIHAMAGGQGKMVINKPGVNITPVFRPGGNNLAIAMSHTGKTNIFLVDLAGNILKRLTNGWGIEVAPSFSPDGKKMAFVSDRGGSPQIYIADLTDGSFRRLTFGFKYCAAPDWSPRGDRIAFQAMIEGTFQVVTITPEGQDVQILTRGYGGAEDPSWSPDGRLIAYAGRRTGRYQIYVMTAGGQLIKRLTSLAGENTDPSWSPRGVAGR